MTATECKSVGDVAMRLEVLVNGEGLRVGLCLRRSARSALRGRDVDARLCVVGDTLLEKVGLALQRDHVHKVELPPLSVAHHHTRDEKRTGFVTP